MASLQALLMLIVLVVMLLWTGFLLYTYLNGWALVLSALLFCFYCGTRSTKGSSK